MQTPQDIKAHVRRVLEQRRVSITRYAELAGLNRVLVARWLGDEHRDCTATTLTKLMRGLGKVESMREGA